MAKERKSSVGIVTPQQFRFAEPPHQLVLESGQKIGPVDVIYETYGTLNESKDNAVLIIHALSGDAHAAGFHTADDKKPGWWDIIIGPGKPVDTSRYFVICSNVLGGCKGTTGPGSINPETNKPYRLSFPVVTISDMVVVQKHLIDYLGIRQLHSVIGGSMGGMQVLDWVLQFPKMVKSAIVVASCAALSAQAIAFDAVGRNAITADPSWNNGNYKNDKRIPGLAVARMLGHITYLSEEGMRERFGRQLYKKNDYSYEFKDEFSIETYLAHKGSVFLDRFDANSYLYVTKAMDYYDVAAQYGKGSLEKAFSKVSAKMLFISFTSDWLFPPRQSIEMVHAFQKSGKAASYLNIETGYGHDSFLLPCDRLFRGIGHFLKHVEADKKRD